MASKEDDDDANPGEAQGITLSAAQVVLSCGRSCCVALFSLQRLSRQTLARGCSGAGRMGACLAQVALRLRHPGGPAGGGPAQ